MKLIASLAFAALALAKINFGENLAGNTYLVDPAETRILGQAPLGAGRLVRSSSTWSPQKIVRSMPLQQKVRFVRSLPLQTKIRLVRSMPTYSTSEEFLPSQRIFRSAPKKNVYNKIVTQQRVLRTPISKTVTVLPNEVTRITRNINQHLPMVHKRVRNYYNVEDVNKKNIIHHFVEPVENKHLGTRQGRSASLATSHVMHKGKFLPEGMSTYGTETDEMEGGDFETKMWKVLEDESCVDIPAGQGVRPKAECWSNGTILDDAECNDLAYPEDIIC
jgi:hypothetical protein